MPALRTLIPPAAVLAALLLVPATAPAATVARLDLPALAAASSVVVRGVVQSQAARVTAEGRIVTDHVVRVDETLAGEAGADTVVVTTLGGVVDGRGQRVPGSPVLVAGDEVVLFLHRPGPPSSLARTSVVGLAQGAFRVDRTSGRPLLVQRLDGLRVLGPALLPVPDDLDVLRATLKALPAAGEAP